MGRQAGCFLNSTSCAVPVLGQKCIAKGMKVRLLPAGGCCMLVDAAADAGRTISQQISAFSYSTQL